jgi:hypothetical protein
MLDDGVAFARLFTSRLLGVSRCASNGHIVAAVHESDRGTFPTCRGGLSMSVDRVPAQPVVAEHGRNDAI